jgi:hypothetical protein
VSDAPSNLDPPPGSRRSTIVAAGLLLVALALVVLYTNHIAFRSPLALVVVAAIGMAALLLQLRLRPEISSSARGPLWLNAIGVLAALAALLVDFIHAGDTIILILALVAVVAFAVSGIIVIGGLRKRRV